MALNQVIGIEVVCQRTGMLVVTGSKHGCSFITRPGGSRIEVSTLGFFGVFWG